jgi:Mor family transcriptional regulator
MERCRAGHLACQSSTCGCPCHGRYVRRSGRFYRHKRRPRIQVATTQSDEKIITDFDAGKSATQIAKEHGRSVPYVQKVLVRSGREPRRYRAAIDLPYEAISGARDEGASISAIARKHGCDRRTIYKVLGMGDMRTAKRVALREIEKELR